jgi:hypothetical protein
MNKTKNNKSDLYVNQYKTDLNTNDKIYADEN